MERNRAFEQREKEARAKLASVQRQQRTSQEPASAQTVSQYMNKLNEGYTNLKKQVSDIQKQAHERKRELVKIESRIKTLQQRTDDIARQDGNIKQAHALRDIMKPYEDEATFNARVKQLEDTYRQSWEYYQKTFNITPNEGHQEITRLQREYSKIYEHAQKDIDLTPYSKRLRDFEIAYKKQRLLAEARPDSREILQSLDRADIKLQRISDDDFKEITRDMPMRQAEVLKHRRYTREREREFYDRVR